MRRWLFRGSKKPNEHKHKCQDEACGRVWRHPDKSPSTAHYCPDCGRYENLKYFGPEEPPANSPANLGLK